MDKSSDQKNIVLRTGTSQEDRLPVSLDPQYIKIDDRSFEERIIWAGEYARYIRYHSIDKAKDQNWSTFFVSQPIAILAKLKCTPVESTIMYFNRLERFLAEKHSDNLLKAGFLTRFHLPFALLKYCFGQLDQLPEHHVPGHEMRQLLEISGKPIFVQLCAYLKGAVEAKYLDDIRPPVILSPFIPIPPGDLVKLLGELDSFIVDLPMYPDTNYQGINANKEPFRSEEMELPEKIFDTLHDNLFSFLFMEAFQLFRKIKEISAKYLHNSFSDNNDVAPQFGLFLAFLHSLEEVRKNINQLTERHLKYYYEDLLKLKRKKEDPNQVHVLFELSEDIDEYLLQKESELDAGQDEEGNPIIYKTDREILINKAEVNELRSVLNPLESSDLDNGLSAFSIVNSLDGEGEKLPKEDPKWFPFGPIANGRSQTGFAIMDEDLIMGEGLRKIHIIFEDISSPQHLADACWDVAITSADGWYTMGKNQFSFPGSGSENNLEIIITLANDEPAIVPFDPAIHTGHSFSTTYPVLKFTLSDTSRFNELRQITVSKIKLYVEVANIRSITVQNRFGNVDPSSPFLPFGATPDRGDYFIFGYRELAGKLLEQSVINIVWNGPPFDYSGSSPSQIPPDIPYQDILVSLSYLKDGSWKKEGGDKHLFKINYNSDLDKRGCKIAQLQPDIEFINDKNNFLGNSKSDILYTDAISSGYSTESNTGFYKVELISDDPMGYAEYRKRQTDHLMKKGRGVSAEYNPEPIEPYIPEIKSITASYNTGEKGLSSICLLHPFGHEEVAMQDQNNFLPEYKNEGELYIGIKNLNDAQSLALLFQIAEGTSDPLLKRESIYFHILRNNQWIEDGFEWVDGTNKLKKSGIVRFAFKENFYNKRELSTILPSDQLWIRLSVAENVGTLPYFIAISGQAASATLKIGDETTAHTILEDGLLPGTITDLISSPNEISAVVQPFPSFGGRLAEKDKNFYMRVSERMRHKSRAIQIWDFERLILEKFPDIYKVKCIKHTSITESDQSTHDSIYVENSNSPGSVCIVVIPNRNKASKFSKLKHYVDVNVLEDIKNFMLQKVTPFITVDQLFVINPHYEEIKVEVGLKFKDEIIDTDYYEEALKAELIKYLTPWAFQRTSDIVFRNRWHKSSIISFIEEQAYVEHIEAISMHHLPYLEDLEVAEARTSASILISAPDHVVHCIKDV